MSYSNAATRWVIGKNLSRIWNCLNGWELGLGEPQIFHKIPCLGFFFFLSLLSSIKGILGVRGCTLSPKSYKFNQVRIKCVH